VGACERFLHIVVRSAADEAAYFAVLRDMASPGVVGPRGLAHIHLVTGAVGDVDQIVKAPGVASCLSMNVLADAVTCASPLEFVPFRVTAPASLGAATVARNLSSALRSAAYSADGAEHDDAAQQVGAAVSAPALLPPRKRGRPAKTSTVRAPVTNQALPGLNGAPVCASKEATSSRPSWCARSGSRR
jgi:hypothetical protein